MVVQIYLGKMPYSVLQNLIINTKPELLLIILYFCTSVRDPTVVTPISPKNRNRKRKSVFFSSLCLHKKYLKKRERKRALGF